MVKLRAQVITRAATSNSAHVAIDDITSNDGSTTHPDTSTTTLETKRDTKVRDSLQPQSVTGSKYSVNEIPRRASSSTRMSVQAYLDEFHIIQWLGIQNSESAKNSGENVAVHNNPDTSVLDVQPRSFFDDRVVSFLTDLDKALSSQPDIEKRLLYQNCPPKLHTEAQKALAGMIKAKLDKPRVIKLKKDLFTAAELLFRAFLPWDQREKICLKLWGSLHRSITGSIEIKFSLAQRTIEVLVETARAAARVQHQLSRGKGPDPIENVLVLDFTKAWHYLLSSLLNMTWTQETIPRAHKNALKCQLAMDKGYAALLGTESNARLREIRTALPVEMTAFLARRVIEDAPYEQDTVETTAWMYFRQIEMQVSEKPFERSHQSRILFLLEEIEVLQHHLNNQRDILAKLAETAAFQPEGDVLDGFHIRTMSSLRDSLDARLNSLQHLRDRVNGLLHTSREHIESNKDRQEAAIYVFTIVTIIFLPISTVSSVLGMNTSDVRDMEQGQWLFWALAIPVTAVTVFASLVGAGVVSLRIRSITSTVHSPSSKLHHAMRPVATYQPAIYLEPPGEPTHGGPPAPLPGGHENRMPPGLVDPRIPPPMPGPPGIHADVRRMVPGVRPMAQGVRPYIPPGVPPPQPRGPAHRPRNKRWG